MSWKQAERQSHRGQNGRYEEMNPCEKCDKSTGSNYFTDDRCNSYYGRGLVLCADCAEESLSVKDEDYPAWIDVKKPKPKAKRKQRA